MSKLSESKGLSEESHEFSHAHKFAELLLKNYKTVKSKDCPLREFLEKSFAERVLFLEDQPRSDLEMMLKRCELCGKCNK